MVHKRTYFSRSSTVVPASTTVLRACLHTRVILNLSVPIICLLRTTTRITLSTDDILRILHSTCLPQCVTSPYYLYGIWIIVIGTQSSYYIEELAASAARGASPQKHVYVRYVSMSVVIYVRPNSMTACYVF
jgi:hypothetical protein